MYIFYATEEHYNDSSDNNSKDNTQDTDTENALEKIELLKIEKENIQEENNIEYISGKDFFITLLILIIIILLLNFKFDSSSNIIDINKGNEKITNDTLQYENKISNLNKEIQDLNIKIEDLQNKLLLATYNTMPRKNKLDFTPHKNPAIPVIQDPSNIKKELNGTPLQLCIISNESNFSNKYDNEINSDILNVTIFVEEESRLKINTEDITENNESIISYQKLDMSETLDTTTQPEDTECELNEIQNILSKYNFTQINEKEDNDILNEVCNLLIAYKQQGITVDEITKILNETISVVIQPLLF